MAVVWSVRGRAVGEGDSRPEDEQVQGIRVRDDVRLRGGTVCDPEYKRVLVGQQGAASEL